MQALGDDLLELCRSAQTELILAAPFVKIGVLYRLLEAVDPHVSITCVTRWRPEEVAAGVSDLEIFDVLTERASGRVVLRADLHAKYYRGDHKVLIGSANLTAAALGWRDPSNYELLVPWEVNETVWKATEAALMSGGIRASASLRDIVAQAAAAIKETLAPVALEEAGEPEETAGARTPSEREFWLPRLRHPDLLFAIYREDNANITEQARADGDSDLAVLRPMRGLQRLGFERAIGAALLQMPTIDAIDRMVAEPRRFGEIRAYLRGRTVDAEGELDPAEAWQTLIRWLLLFLPDRYDLAVPGEYSEVFRRRT